MRGSQKGETKAAAEEICAQVICLISGYIVLASTTFVDARICVFWIGVSREIALFPAYHWEVAVLGSNEKHSEAASPPRDTSPEIHTGAASAALDASRPGSTSDLRPTPNTAQEHLPAMPLTDTSQPKQNQLASDASQPKPDQVAPVTQKFHELSMAGEGMMTGGRAAKPHERVNDGAAKPEANDKTPDPQRLDQERERLKKDAADLIKSDPDRARFLSDMDKFEQRAKTQKLPDKEVANTYSQMSRMMESKDGITPQADRILAGEQLAHHLGDPSNIDQGHNNTCNVTTLGERLVIRNPSKAAEMVATTTLNGSWTAPDGKQIKIDSGSLIPGTNEKNNPPNDSERSYATQVMNLVLANDSSQRRNPPLTYSQERKESVTDSGEHLRFPDGREVKQNDLFLVKDEDKDKPVRGPGIVAADIARMGEQLTGDKGFVLAHPEVAVAKEGVVLINNTEQMEKTLTALQKTGKMPAILQVDANDKLFGGTGDPKTAGQLHAVSITALDPVTHKVTIDNQWGKSRDQTVSSGDLFRATHLAH